MSIVKNGLDFIVRNVLFKRRAKNGHGKTGRDVVSLKTPSIKTLRTYPRGGDPVDDAIEFVLTDDGTSPSGFENLNRFHLCGIPPLEP